jgi:ketosteroid isomerase-like protein
MSQENVEIVRRWFEAFSSENFDAAIALVHGEVVFVPPGGQAPYAGVESLRRWMGPDVFLDQVAHPLEITAASDRTILARQHVTGRGRASGIDLDTITWSVWTLDEDGLITRIEIYLPHEKGKALEAAGLRE